MSLGQTTRQSRFGPWIWGGWVWLCCAFVMVNCYSPLPRPHITEFSPWQTSETLLESVSSSHDAGADAQADDALQDALASEESCGALLRCDGLCVDSSQDDMHCGECNRVCRYPQRCEKSRCVCPVDLFLCGNACVDTSLNPLHCGLCSRACGANETCEQGRCVEGNPCTSPQVPCLGQCVDILFNPSHCGVCEKACGPNQSCVNGVCQDNGCSGPQDCQPGQVCVNRICRACRTDAECPSRHACISGACKSISCSKTTDCTGGLVCKGSYCVACSSASDCPLQAGKPYSKTQSQAMKNGQQVDFSFSNLPIASGNLKVTVSLRGDFTSDSEYATIAIDGQSQGKFAPNTDSKVSKTYTVSGNLANDGKVVVRVKNTSDVDDSVCWVLLEYSTLVPRPCEAGRCK